MIGESTAITRAATIGLDHIGSTGTCVMMTSRLDMMTPTTPWITVRKSLYVVEFDIKSLFIIATFLQHAP
jgi:hypothetical protein